MALKKSSRRSNSTRNVNASMKLKKLIRRRSMLWNSALRRMVRKEVKKQVREILNAVNSLAELNSTSGVQGSSQCTQSFTQAESSGQRKLRLHFVYKLPKTLFTANIVYAHGPEARVPVRVELLDENNNVVNGSPLSSLRIEVFVVDGDFEAEEWTGEKLETSRIHGRKEKGSLLVGTCIRTMENGVCSFDDLKFTDNSSWIPRKKFRLVAIVTESDRVIDMVEIRQAISGPFRVKDQRGKPYEKSEFPSWDDEVWRLEKIGMKGPCHKRLVAEGIYSVMDFLRKYYMDQSSLSKILGVNKGVWKTIVEHAQKCIPNSLHFRYASEKGVELLFNCFYELIRVSFDHQNFHPLETLDENGKFCAEQLRKCAFEDQSKLVELNLPSVWPSDNINTVWSSANTNACIVQYPDSQDPTVTPNQDEPVQDTEAQFNYISYPLTPLLPDSEILHYHQEAPEARSISTMNYPFLRSDSMLWDSLIINQEILPLSAPNLIISANYMCHEQASSSMPVGTKSGRIWYRARAAVTRFLVASRINNTRMLTAGS